jgi:hypothetical protein
VAWAVTRVVVMVTALIAASTAESNTSVAPRPAMWPQPHRSGPSVTPSSETRVDSINTRIAVLLFEWLIG